MYVLVTQVVPNLQCFFYKEGLARFATEEYTTTVAKEDNICMHLTNYAINKESENFKGNESDFKKSLQQTLDIIKEKEGEEKVKELWNQMIDICLKTILVGYPHLEHNYKSCTSKASYRNNH